MSGMKGAVPDIEMSMVQGRAHTRTDTTEVFESSRSRRYLGCSADGFVPIECEMSPSGLLDTLMRIKWDKNVRKTEI